MNVTINIYGDVHIHCDCCDGCGVYDDNFDDALEALQEASTDTVSFSVSVMVTSNSFMRAASLVGLLRKKRKKKRC